MSNQNDPGEHGRIYGKSKDAEEWRSDPHIDRDRVWYSSEFRRLGGVTQVVPPQEDFLFHDRLTHSIKVAQVAETIARRLLHKADANRWKTEHSIDLAKWVDPDYCYVAGLAHDIGHPPFGHAGEAQLQDLLDAENNMLLRDRSFEGNAQSTRIIATLSFRKHVDRRASSQEYGINPMLRSVAAIAKYPWVRGDHPHALSKLSKKWSFYPEEEWILKLLVDEKYVAVERSEVQDSEGNPVKDRNRATVTRVDAVHRWPEAEIMDWADDISYAVHDVEDFYRAGRIPLHLIADALGAAASDTDWEKSDFTELTQNTETSAALRYCREKMGRLRDREGIPMTALVPVALEQVWHRYLDFFPKAPFDGSRRSHVNLHQFASELITDLISSASLECVVVDEKPRVTCVVDARAQLVAEFFKSLCHYYVIRTSMLSTMQRGQALTLARVHASVCELAREWMSSGGGPSVDADHSLPARLREYIGDVVPSSVSLDEDHLGAAVNIAVIDYLCSLRDKQAYLLAARLGGDQGVSWTGTWIDG